MTLTDLINEYDKNCEGMLEATEQSVYISLLLIWNRLRRPEWFRVSQPELMRKAGIKGHNRLERAQNGLEEKGFISTSKKARTATRLYKLEPLPTTSEIDLATLKTDVNSTSITDAEKTATLKTDVSYVQNEPNLRPKQTSSQRQSITEYSLERDSNANLESISQGEDALPPLSPAIKSLYEEKIGPLLNGEHEKLLRTLCQEQTEERVTKAINKSAYKGIRNLNYIRGILNNWTEADDREGGTKRGTYGQRSRESHERLTAEEELAKWEAVAKEYGQPY